MAGVINELVTKFDFKGDTKPLTDFNDGLSGSIKLLAGIGAATAAAIGAVGAYTASILKSIDPLTQLHRETNVAVATIQELGFVASQTGSDAGALQSTIGSLSQKIGEAAQKGSEDFARLGISVRNANGQVKNADQVLDEVRVRFQQLGLSMNEQRGFASALGIDTSLLQMMNLTGNQIAELRAEASAMGTLTNEQAEQATAFNDAMQKMGFAVDAVKQSLAVGLAPEMTRMAGVISDLIAENKEWIIEGLQATAKFIGDLLAAINRLLPVFGLIAAGFLIAKISAIGFGAVMGAIFSPVVLITAGIIALLVIVDDLIVAFSGGQSVIGDFFKEFLGVDLAVVFDDVVEAVSRAFDVVFPFFELLSDLASIGFDGLKDIIGSVGEFFGFGGDDASVPQSVPAGGSGASVDNRSVNQQVNVEVRSDDPQAAGQAVADSVQRQMDEANAQLGRGGR